LLRAAVGSYPLDAVCLAQRASTPEAREVLRDAGLQRTNLSPGFEIWSRREPGSDRRPSRACRVALPFPNSIRGTSGWLRQAFGYSRPAPSSPTREAVKPLSLGEDGRNGVDLSIVQRTLATRFPPAARSGLLCCAPQHCSRSGEGAKTSRDLEISASQEAR